jgi:hypothetical protein
VTPLAATQTWLKTGRSAPQLDKVEGLNLRKVTSEERKGKHGRRSEKSSVNRLGSGVAIKAALYANPSLQPPLQYISLCATSARTCETYC